MANFVEKEQGSTGSVQWGKMIGRASLATGATMAGVAVGGALGIPGLSDIYEGTVGMVQEVAGILPKAGLPASAQGLDEIWVKGNPAELMHARGYFEILGDGTMSLGSAVKDLLSYNLKLAVGMLDLTPVQQAVEIAQGLSTEAIGNASILLEQPPEQLEQVQKAIAGGREAFFNFSVNLANSNIPDELMPKVIEHLKDAHLQLAQQIAGNDAVKLAELTETINNFDWGKYTQIVTETEPAKVGEKLSSFLADHYHEAGLSKTGNLVKTLSENALLGAGLGVGTIGAAMGGATGLSSGGDAAPILTNERMENVKMGFAAKEQMRAVNALMEARMQAFGQGQSQGASIA